MKCKKAFSHELVYFTGRKRGILDFSGEEDGMSVSERINFLAQYEKAAKRWYGEDACMQKAADMAEAEAFVASVKHVEPKIRREILFNDLTACAVKKPKVYQNAVLYCGAAIDEQTLTFPDKYVRPTACAKIELKKALQDASFSFSVYIPESYRSPHTKYCGDAHPGRVIELRHKTLDVMRIKLFNTGEACAVSGKMWEPIYTPLGHFSFGVWNTVCITLGEKATVSVNGKITEHIERSRTEAVDNIFFDGGMFPEGSWRVKDIRINEKAFVWNSITEAEESETLGLVSLPYAIGGYERKDHYLLLTKHFDAGTYSNALLYMQSLDPCGKVWLNGHLILDTDGFEEQTIDVTSFLKAKDNELKILVEPRAPEVYYFWHRHTDCYNGWFCGRVKLILTEDMHITGMDIVCKSTSPQIAGEGILRLNVPAKGHAAIYVSQCYPAFSKESLLTEIPIEGENVSFSFQGDFTPWTPDNPVLYAVRGVVYDADGHAADDFVVETGFRTIEQKDGEIYLNGEKTFLCGALIMQFLPPLDEVPINHNCPADAQIVWQTMMLKNMNGNLMRLHLLGYGTNDVRYAEICDRLGMMLIWTTRYIDSSESMAWDRPWPEQAGFARQINCVKNYPSIIMYEGSNEYHSRDLATVDRLYDSFCEMADSVDTTRLLSPCSHLYYGGGIYELGCKYYNDEGTADEMGNPATSGQGWRHPRVIRSSHTYSLLCGYGAKWQRLRTQNWQGQPPLLASHKHSYLITEFAVTALANPNTPEAQAAEYVESYERPNEWSLLDRIFEQEEWGLSQSYQALCAFNAVKHMRMLGVDGMTWCCLSSGANNGSYMKPPIDFYGYKKLGFYALKEAYNPLLVAKHDTRIGFGTEDAIQPVVINTALNGIFTVCVQIEDENGCVIDEKQYTDIKISSQDSVVSLEAFYPKWKQAGHYGISYCITEQ